MYGMKKSELRLVPHDPAWSDDFLAERARIASVLDDSSARIEHVGSTAIPTVHAKPILDIAILCGPKGLAPVVQALRQFGYEYRGPYGDEPAHHYAVLDRGDVRLCQVHLFAEATADWWANLRFRDVLRRDIGLARAYDDYKQRLAKVTADKREYAAIKSRWLDDFMPRVLRARIDT